MKKMTITIMIIWMIIISCLGIEFKQTSNIKIYNNETNDNINEYQQNDMEDLGILLNK